MESDAGAGQVRHLLPQPTLAVRLRCAPREMQVRVPASPHRVAEVLDAAGAGRLGPSYTRYLAHFPEQGVFELEIGVPARCEAPGSGDVIISHLPGGRALCLWHEGPYASLGSSFELLNRLRKEQALVAASPPWEAYVVSGATESDPAKWRTELYQPIEK